MIHWKEGMSYEEYKKLPGYYEPYNPVERVGMTKEEAMEFFRRKDGSLGLGPAPAPTVPSAFDVQVGGQHYAKWKIQPLQYILANKIPFLEGNVIKYVTRWRDKAGVQDLEKAKHYIEMLIETEKNKND